MTRKVSPVFAAIVIVFVLVLGGLWFVVRYRSQEALDAARAELMQKQAARMQWSEGRMQQLHARQMMQLRATQPGGQGERGRPGLPPGEGVPGRPGGPALEGEASAPGGPAGGGEQEVAEEQP